MTVHVVGRHGNPTATTPTTNARRRLLEKLDACCPRSEWGADNTHSCQVGHHLLQLYVVRKTMDHMGPFRNVCIAALFYSSSIEVARYALALPRFLVQQYHGIIAGLHDKVFSSWFYRYKEIQYRAVTSSSLLRRVTNHTERAPRSKTLAVKNLSQKYIKQSRI